jgi:predicted ester cyclase
LTRTSVYGRKWLVATAIQENVAISQRLIEDAFGKGHLDLVDDLCTEAYVDHDPLLGEQGRDEVKQTIGSYREAFPDLAFTVEDVIAADDKVVVRWRAEGTFQHEFMGQEPTGEKGEPVEGIAIDRYEDGKVAESWGQWDTLRFMRNIGAVPAVGDEVVVAH